MKPFDFCAALIQRRSCGGTGLFPRQYVQIQVGQSVFTRQRVGQSGLSRSRVAKYDYSIHLVSSMHGCYSPLPRKRRHATTVTQTLTVVNPNGCTQEWAGNCLAWESRREEAWLLFKARLLSSLFSYHLNSSGRKKPSFLRRHFGDEEYSYLFRHEPNRPRIGRIERVKPDFSLKNLAVSAQSAQSAVYDE